MHRTFVYFAAFTGGQQGEETRIRYMSKGLQTDRCTCMGWLRW